MVNFFAIAAMTWTWTIFSYYYSSDSPSSKYVLPSFIPYFILNLLTIKEVIVNFDSIQLTRTSMGVDIVDAIAEQFIYKEVLIVVAFIYAIPGTIYLIWKAREHAHQNKRQYYLIVTAGLTFIIGGLIDALDLHPYPKIHIVPFVFTAAGFFLWGAVYQYGFLDVLPVARARVVERLQQAVFVVDEENRIIDANKSASQIIGRKPEEIYDNKIFTIWPKIEKYTGDTLDEEQTIIGLESTVNDDLHYFNINITPLNDVNEKYIGATLTFNDVTEKTRQQKKIEETKVELEKQNTQLERQKEELLQQKTEVQRQNEQLEQFASVLSHDLRNPLGMAKGYTEMLDVEGEEQEKYLDNIHTGINRIDEMVNDLLTLSQKGKTIQETEYIKLEELAQTSWNTVDVDGKLTIMSSMGMQVDVARMKNVFENLYRNSVEHAEPDTDVEIYVGVLDDEDGFFIEDNGPGIPEEHHDDIFEYGKTFSDDGTGFGLAIVDKIIEAHGWRIETVDGEIGDGARFEVYGVNFEDST